MSNININSNKPSVLKAVLIASLVALSASFSFALPSTGAANMQIILVVEPTLLLLETQYLIAFHQPLRLFLMLLVVRKIP
jgi:hypothetical protein